MKKIDNGGAKFMTKHKILLLNWLKHQMWSNKNFSVHFLLLLIIYTQITLQAKLVMYSYGRLIMYSLMKVVVLLPALNNNHNKKSKFETITYFAFLT